MQCVSPITLEDPVTGKYNSFPCGSCKYCREIRRSHWSFRLHQEWKDSVTSAFYTLTYEDMHLPLEEDPPLSGMYKPMLFKPHLQSFIKRLRTQKERNRKGKRNHLDKSWNEPIRYFAVGEYGEEFGRPHYHAIIFNIPEEMQVRDVQNKWNKGNIHVGEVNEASIHYCTKYALKKENFALMSRRPGIGYRYLDNKEVKAWHESGNDYLSYNGHKMSMPRYYKEKYIENSSNYRKVEYWDKVEGKEIVRYEVRPHYEQKLQKDFIEREDKTENKYIIKGKNPITVRGEEDRNRYKEFGNKFKRSKLD